MSKKNMNNPLVSIIIPVYKVEKYLEKSVLSAVDQEYKNIEIILIDDGSPDLCPMICDELKRRYDCIRVVHQKNKGLSGARNTGIKRVSPESKYIIFLDSDDIICSDAIVNMVSIAEDNNSDMVIPDRYIQIEEMTGKRKLRYHFIADCYYQKPIEYALKVILGRGRGARSHSLLYKTSKIVENAVTFPEGYTSEDIVFNLRLIPYLDRLDFYNKPTVLYLKREGSITTSFDKNYFNTIIFIDSQVKEFLSQIKREDDEYAISMQESFLCRNTLAYVKKILSRSNNASIKERKKFALEILKDSRLSGIFQKKHRIPYFQNIKGRIYFKLMYYLLRKNKYRLAISLAALFC